MLFLGIGVVLLVMKYFEIGFVATWSWFLVLAPFAAALLWWEFLVPLLGLDRRTKVDDVEKNKRERIRKMHEK